MEALLFTPFYVTKVWGGRILETLLGRALPGDQPVGESWEIVDRKDAQSVIKNGRFAGMSLGQAVQEHREAILGPKFPENRPFPILVKWLDCNERLSLQVHPPAKIAPELGGEPKTECWYFAHTKPGAAIFTGLKIGVTREQFENNIANNTLEPLVHRIEVEKDNAMFVPSGRLHAIDAGNLILEIQQNSNTTYRVYDWGRVGLDGKPRDLHIEDSLKSIDFEDFEPELSRVDAAEGPLVDCPDFRLTKYSFTQGQSIKFPAREQPRAIHIISGKLMEKESKQILSPGDNALLVYEDAYSFEAQEDSLFLVTDNFVPC